MTPGLSAQPSAARPRCAASRSSTTDAVALGEDQRGPRRLVVGVLEMEVEAFVAVREAGGEAGAVAVAVGIVGAAALIHRGKGHHDGAEVVGEGLCRRVPVLVVTGEVLEAVGRMIVTRQGYRRRRVPAGEDFQVLGGLAGGARVGVHELAPIGEVVLPIHRVSVEAIPSDEERHKMIAGGDRVRGPLLRRGVDVHVPDGDDGKVGGDGQSVGEGVDGNVHAGIEPPRFGADVGAVDDAQNVGKSLVVGRVAFHGRTQPASRDRVGKGACGRPGTDRHRQGDVLQLVILVAVERPQFRKAVAW